jgi:hypothetical protein
MSSAQQQQDKLIARLNTFKRNFGKTCADCNEKVCTISFTEHGMRKLTTWCNFNCEHRRDQGKYVWTTVHLYA